MELLHDQPGEVLLQFDAIFKHKECSPGARSDDHIGRHWQPHKKGGAFKLTSDALRGTRENDTQSEMAHLVDLNLDFEADILNGGSLICLATHRLYEELIGSLRQLAADL